MTAPFAKGPKEAAAGICPIYVGGYKQVWERCEKLLVSVGEPFYMGDIEQAVSFKKLFSQSFQ